MKLLEYLAAAAAEAAAAAAAAKTQEAQGVTSPSARVSDGAEPSGRISDSGTTGSVHAPLPALSPRIDPRSPGGRLLPHSGSGQGGPGHHHRGSIESTMSRFSTSTGGDSSDSEEDLASALDELSKEMAGGCGAGQGGGDSGIGCGQWEGVAAVRDWIAGGMEDGLWREEERISVRAPWRHKNCVGSARCQVPTSVCKQRPAGL